MEASPDGVTATVMGIRDILMQYFKDGGMVVQANNLWADTCYRYGNRRYERFLHDVTKPMNVFIHDQDNSHTLLTMQHSPDSITLHLGVLDRSKAMRGVKEGIEKFMAKYLRGVEVNTDTGGDKTAWRSDRALVNRALQPVPATSPLESSYRYPDITLSAGASLNEAMLAQTPTAGNMVITEEQWLSITDLPF